MTKQKMLLVKSDRSTVVADSTLSDKATEIFNSFELLGRQNFTAVAVVFPMPWLVKNTEGMSLTLDEAVDEDLLFLRSLSGTFELKDGISSEEFNKTIRDYE